MIIDTRIEYVKAEFSGEEGPRSVFVDTAEKPKSASHMAIK